MTEEIVKICRVCSNAFIDKISGVEFKKLGYRSCAAATTPIERATYFRGDTPCRWPEQFLAKAAENEPTLIADQASTDHVTPPIHANVE